MNSLNLPAEARRTALRSFWVLLSILFGTGVWLASYCFHLPFSLLLGLAVSAVFGLLVFAKENLVRRLYHAWNRKLVQPLASLAASAVMGICFFIIFVGVGRAGSLVRLDGHGRTTWRRRSSLLRDAYQLPFNSKGKSPQVGWIRSYLHWAARSGNAWSICLIPFLCFLKLLSNAETKEVEGNIYTLF
jgi:hypothetical protein